APLQRVAKAPARLRQLPGCGPLVVVIEHNLDVMRSADWILDLGPEGGNAGGYIVCEGTPAQVMAHATSHTGKALRDYQQKIGSVPISSVQEPAGRYLGNLLRIHNAREHNL